MSMKFLKIIPPTLFMMTGTVWLLNAWILEKPLPVTLSYLFLSFVFYVWAVIEINKISSS